MPLLRTGWEHFLHGADMGVRGFGITKGDAFERGALAPTAIIAAPAGITPGEAVEIKFEAPDDELLSADWFTAMVYEIARHGILIRGSSSRGVVGEAPGAYRHVSAAVDAAEAVGLARKVARLEPSGCVKG